MEARHIYRTSGAPLQTATLTCALHKKKKKRSTCANTREPGHVRKYCSLRAWIKKKKTMASKKCSTVKNMHISIKSHGDCKERKKLIIYIYLFCTSTQINISVYQTHALQVHHKRTKRTMQTRQISCLTLRILWAHNTQERAQAWMNIVNECKYQHQAGALRMNMSASRKRPDELDHKSLKVEI